LTPITKKKNPNEEYCDKIEERRQLRLVTLRRIQIKDSDKLEIRNEKHTKMKSLSAAMRELEWMQDLLTCAK
jgi:hypothetical protein